MTSALSELEAYQDGLTSPFWGYFAAYITREWGPSGIAFQQMYQAGIASKDWEQVVAANEVGFVGEIVAAVVASNRYVAEDAADLIDIDYEPLEAVVDPERALEPGSPLVHPEWGDNVHRAYVHVLSTAVIPNLSQKEQTKVLDHLKTQAAGASVHPGASSTSAKPIRCFAR